MALFLGLGRGLWRAGFSEQMALPSLICDHLHGNVFLLDTN